MRLHDGSFRSHEETTYRHGRNDYREAGDDVSMADSQWPDHGEAFGQFVDRAAQRCAFFSSGATLPEIHRAASMGHNTIVPGRMIILNPQDAFMAAGSIL
ncbi:MAG: hypothetical protein LR011_04665 [Verrucomicrobia bacterium]|nr:hypothetical protein [Verrucomicrobiota bacterium]